MPSLNPACEKCGLYKTTTGTVCLAGEGPRDAKVMVVGEAPGREEERTGRPFMGSSGKKLREELRKNGLDVFITNTVRCRPPDNRTPSAAEIKACREYLDYEIGRIKPEIVVSLGATPTKALFKGVAAVSKHHGKLIPPDKHPFTGYVSYHPAAMLYNPGLEVDFQRDIARLARIVRDEPPPDNTLNWSILRRGNLQKFLREFRAAPEFSFDLETSGLFMHDGKGWINCVGIGLKNRTWVIPRMRPGWYPSRANPKKLKFHRGSPWCRGKSFEFLMRMIIGMAIRGNKGVIAQNGKFDNLWLQRYVKRRFRITFDTMLASHTLDENEDHDLKSMSRKHLDVPEYDLTTAEKRGIVDPMKLFQYNARDCGYTLRLKKVFQERLEEEKDLFRLFYELVMPAVRAMEDIELEGKTMNVEALDMLGLDLLSREIKLKRALNKLVGKEVNWGSPKQVGVVLYEDLGIKCTLKTPKGANSTSEAAILDLKGKHPVVDKLIEYREVAKFRSTYVIGFKELMVDDRLYISYKIHGTVTGRYSSRIHSIPRDGSVRNLVIAPPGWKFFQADISQAELRIIAQMSGDLEMRKCFLEGIDIHWRTLMFAIAAGYIKGDYAQRVKETANQLILGHKDEDISITEACEICLDYGHEKAIEVWPGWKEGRKKAKAINFGYVYGMYEKKFVQTAKEKYQWEPTWDEAHACREGYFQLYSDLPRWHEKQKKLVKLNGFVRTFFGRRRRLPGIESSEKGLRMEAERQAINSPVQGTIGDWKAAVLVEMHELDHDKLRLVGEHHDALLGLVRDGCEDEMLPRVIEIIRKPRLLRTFKIRMEIPMDGEIEVGPWGAGKKYTPPLPTVGKAA
jgi:DNA polymerase-1